MCWLCSCWWDSAKCMSRCLQDVSRLSMAWPLQSCRWIVVLVRLRCCNRIHCPDSILQHTIIPPMFSFCGYCWWLSRSYPKPYEMYLFWSPRSSRSFSRFRARLAERGRVHWGNTGNVKFIVTPILSWNSWHVFNIFSICFHQKNGWLNRLRTGGCCTVPPQWSRIPRDAREQRGIGFSGFMQLQFIGFSRGIFHNEDPLQKSHFSRDSLEHQESFFLGGDVSWEFVGSTRLRLQRWVQMLVQ